jgi:NTE family protein
MVEQLAEHGAAGIMQRWDAGYRHTRAVLERKPWVGEFDPLAGVVLHEHMEMMTAPGMIA